MTDIAYTTDGKPFEFDVALSFAEEDRVFVHRVARHLKRKEVKLFYDKDAMIDTWGKNMYTHLDDIYRNKARFCVMFISKHYKRKRWTRHERDSAQARAFFSENKEYILPFRFDDTEIEGMKDTIGYLPINDFDEKQLAEAIVAKLRKARNLPLPQTLHTAKNIGLTPMEKTGRFLRLRIKAVLAILVTGITLGLALNYNSFMHEESPASPSIQGLYNSDKRWIKGSRCRDGSFSTSRGPGTCSHHGGVAYLDSALADTFKIRKK